MSSFVNPFLQPVQGPPAPNWWDNEQYRRLAKTEDGEEVIFFTIGALAQAVQKKPVTIKKWLQLHYIPEPAWRSPGWKEQFGGAGVRLWTKEQIDGIVKIATEEGIIGSRPHTMAATNFPQRVFGLWNQMKW
jgi:hypothetical protein